MIRPGLLTASTNKADHLGTSGAGLVACRCMVGAPFAARVFGLGLKTVFPPRRDVGTRVGARTHTRRGERSGALRGFAESCAGGLSWHNRPVEGKTKLDLSAGMERSRGLSAVRQFVADNFVFLLER
jgi:hypothetical protein